MPVTINNRDDFHKFVEDIKKISQTNSECLTTKLTSQKGKLDGRIVTLIKVILSFITRHQFAQTTPHKVAKVLSRFVRDHKTFLTDADRAVLIETLKKLSLKDRNKNSSSQIFDRAILKIRSIPHYEHLKKELDDCKAPPLFYAILENDFRKASQLVLAGEKPNSPNAFGELPLHFAIKAGSFELTKFLFSETTKNTKNAAGDTSLCLAAHTGDSKLVRFLIEKGADRMIPDHAERLPLHLAASIGNEKLVNLLYSDLSKNLKDADGNTPLAKAAEAGSYHVVKFLLDKGADAMLPNSKGEYPLHFAAKSGNEELVKLLYSEACKDIKDLEGNTPLAKAAEAGSHHVVKFLLAKGADAMLPNLNGVLPLHLAAKLGNLELVKTLFSEEVKDRQDNFKKSPIVCAILSGNSETVKFLLEMKVNLDLAGQKGNLPIHVAVLKKDIAILKLLISDKKQLNSKGWSGYTPLCLAAKLEQFEISKFLFDQGADISISDEEGDLPIHSAAYLNDSKLFELLYTESQKDTPGNEGMTPIACAADSGNLDVVKFLLEKKANFLQPAIDGDLPLHFAASKGSEEIVKLLCTESTKNTQGFNGDTPLHCAIKTNSIDVVQFLLDNQVNLISPNEQGDLPIHLAVEDDRILILEKLLALADLPTFLNVQNNQKFTPLCLAAKNSFAPIVKLLLDKGADFLIFDKDNSYPLHWSAAKGDFELVELLYTDKIKDVQDDLGCSPLIYAVESENVKSVKFLLEKGVDRTIADEDGDTPIHYALYNGNLEILKLVFSDVTKDNQGKGGCTPLNLAVKFNNLLILEFLIEKGADRSIPNNAGNLPLHKAAAKNAKAVQLLVTPETVNVKNKKGKTPLDIAKETTQKISEDILIKNGAK